MLNKEDKAKVAISNEVVDSLVRRLNGMAASVACLPDLVDDVQAMAEFEQIAFENRKTELLFSTRIHALNHQTNDVYLWVTLLKEVLIDIGADPDAFDDNDGYFFNGESFPKIADAVFQGKAVEDAED